MSTINDGESAFPGYGQYGMTLRDWFAGKALEGMLAGVVSKSNVGKDGIALHSSLAPTAYEMADAMIAAREGKK